MKNQKSQTCYYYKTPISPTSDNISQIAPFRLEKVAPFTNPLSKFEPDRTLKKVVEADLVQQLCVVAVALRISIDGSIDHKNLVGVVVKMTRYKLVSYHISQWEPQLQEGRNYIVDDFDVICNEGQYRDVIGDFIDIEMSHSESMPKKVIFIMRDQRSSL
ncbi:hypothetical protein Lal_00041428 [Lupinus albus]|nr:hypothetical protein Lal_00041428 [Lupinus albus]